MIDFETMKNIRGSFSSTKKYDFNNNPILKEIKDTLVFFDMPTNNFFDNLKTLIIEEDSASKAFGVESNVLGSYDPVRNILNKPNDECDFIHELYHMASNKNDGTSSMGLLLIINDKTIGISLNEGITDLFTSLTRKEYIPRYPIQMLFANMLADYYSIDIYKEYFGGNSVNFYKQFKDDLPEILNIVVYLDDYTRQLDSLSIGDSFKINSLVDSFIIAWTSLINYVLKKDRILAENYLKRLKRLFKQPNDNIQTIKLLFESSEYGDINSVLEEIKNNTVNTEEYKR